jgi:LCP family protein required for cell wall assembly
MITRMNYQADEDVRQFETLPEQAMEVSTEVDPAGNVLNESELENLHTLMNQAQTIQRDDDAVMDQSVYNVLIAGVDRDDKSWNGNADSIMLVSLNNDKKRASVISLMRDTYVEIPGHDYNKLNASYAYGGGPLLCDTVEENYRIPVERYAAVDFENLIDIVDALGGIEIDWTENEIEVANGYIKDMCERVLDIPYEEHAILDGPGVHLSDGVQAVAYARNRFVGNSDYTRTQRQRYVIQQMVKKIKSLSSTQLLGFVQKVLPLVTHNLPENEIWSLVWDAPSILKYDIVMDRVPYDGMYSEIDVGGQGMLVPDWNETISQMHRTIYGDGSISGNEDNDMDTSKYELTDEYMEMTGGTGTLFPEGFTGELATERQTEQTGKSESLPKQRP